MFATCSLTPARNTELEAPPQNLGRALARKRFSGIGIIPLRVSPYTPQLLPILGFWYESVTFSRGKYKLFSGIP